MIQEYYNAHGEVRNDPLYVPVAQLAAQKKELDRLNGLASQYIIPELIKGRYVPSFNQAKSAEVSALAMSIDTTRGRITSLEEKISRLDAVIDKHGLEMPLVSIDRLRSEIGGKQDVIRQAEKNIGISLGNVLSQWESSPEKAKLHPQYTDAVDKHRQAVKLLEPEIQKLSAALREISEELSGNESGAPRS